MADDRPPEAPVALAWRAVIRTVGRSVLSVLLILWTLLDVLLLPLIRPLIAWLGGWQFFEWVGVQLGRLPPYVALLIFAVPFIVIEPLKAFALYWFGVGHYFQGGTLYVLGHLASILIVERIYHATRDPLMQIGWFRQLMGWLDGVRKIAVNWAESTSIWQASAQFAREVRTTVRAWVRELRRG